MDVRITQLTQAYQELGPAVRAYALRHAGSQHEADEILQETFLAVAQDLESFLRATSRRAWLIAIARNVMRNRIRRMVVRRAISLDAKMAAEPTLVSDPRLDDMRQAIRSLPEIQREVLELRLAEDLSYQEIAEALGIPIGTVRSRLHHAVALLRDWAKRFSDRNERARSFGARH